MVGTSSRAVTLSTMNSGCAQEEGVDGNAFPAGLRVLVVDDDPICLLILDRMLRRCLYKVTTCGRAIEALNILRENKDGFDLVISDVYMPDMDGFKLLELVGLEMDLPVIMMSTNGETSAVMKGIEHGACNYLLKPVRIEELKNIWQHVVRRQKRDADLLGNIEDQQQDNYSEQHTSASDGPDGASKYSKKRKEMKEEEEEIEEDNEEPSTMKKPRVVWSVELHQQFVNAVNRLGIDKAVPKRILELMDVRGLTRENVASHLQKYRLYLKRISGVAHHTGSLCPNFGGVSEATFGNVLGDLQLQLSPQLSVSNLHPGLLGLGRFTPNNSGNAGVNQSLLQMAALNSANSGVLSRSSYGQPLLNSSGNPYPSISNSMDLNSIKNRQQQIATLSQPEQGTVQLSALQQYVNSVSSAGVGQPVGFDDFVPIKLSNSPLMLQTPQQPRHSQVGSGTTVDASAGSQHGVSDEIAAEILHVDGFENCLSAGAGSHFKPEQKSSLNSIGFTSSNGFGSFVKNVGSDVPNFSGFPAGNASNDFPSIESSSTSCGNDGSIIIRNKSFVSDADDVSPWNGRVISDSGSNLSSGFHMGPGSSLAWQSLGFSQELGQTTGNFLSPLCNQASSGQAVKLGYAKEQGHASNFQDNGLFAHKGNFRPIVATVPQQSPSELDLKVDLFDPPMGIKMEKGSLPETFLSSDDLVSAYFKQQHEAIRPSEGDFPAEGYALGNMYVK